MREIQKVKFQCDKCGIEYEYTPQKYYSDGEDGYWNIDLGRAGYGSQHFDGCDLKFDICDNCLYEFVLTFKHKDRIFDSGRNFSYEELG